MSDEPFDALAWAKRAADALRACHNWMQGEFSDSDFDQDGQLSEADAAAFSAAYDADKAIAAIALMRWQSWQPISEAPVCDFIEKEAPKCLVYGKGVGVHMGRAWRYPGGEAKAQAFGFHGDWPLTHFCNLPTPPKDPADEQ